MEETEWLPVVKFDDGAEFIIDIEARLFRSSSDPEENVGFYSEKGREMVKAMVGNEWRGWWFELVVACVKRGGSTESRQSHGFIHGSLAALSIASSLALSLAVICDSRSTMFSNW